jgi:hypothetical protein
MSKNDIKKIVKLITTISGTLAVYYVYVKLGVLLCARVMVFLDKILTNVLRIEDDVTGE